MNDRRCRNGGSRRTPKPVPAALAVALLAMACGAASAQDDAPLQSPECLRALDALQRQEAAAAAAASRPDAGDRASVARRPPDDARGPQRLDLPAPLQAARHRAAVACLGARADLPLPPRRPVLTAPISAPPIGYGSLPPALPTLADPARAPPVRIAPPPVTVTTCDAVSCWTSDGMRWQRSGAGLVGPGGMCSGVAGGVLRCP